MNGIYPFCNLKCFSDEQDLISQPNVLARVCGRTLQVPSERERVTTGRRERKYGETERRREREQSVNLMTKGRKFSLSSGYKSRKVNKRNYIQRETAL